MSVHDNLLVADFSQCFEQIRHYDESLRKILEFAIAGIVFVLTACAALARNGFTGHTLTNISVILLLSSLCSGILSIAAAQNRVYYSQVCRYVNEIRAAYLKGTSAPIQNRAGMYTDHRIPTIFNPLSSQTMQMYLLAVAFATVFALGCCATAAAASASRGHPPEWNWVVAILAFIAFSFVQIGSVVRYWRTREQKLQRSKAAQEGQ